MIGCKAYVSTSFSPSNSMAQPWIGGGNYETYFIFYFHLFLWEN